MGGYYLFLGENARQLLVGAFSSIKLLFFGKTQRKVSKEKFFTGPDGLTIVFVDGLPERLLPFGSPISVFT